MKMLRAENMRKAGPASLFKKAGLRARLLFSGVLAAGIMGIPAQVSAEDINTSSNRNNMQRAGGEMVQKQKKESRNLKKQINSAFGRLKERLQDEGLWNADVARLTNSIKNYVLFVNSKSYGKLGMMELKGAAMEAESELREAVGEDRYKTLMENLEEYAKPTVDVDALDNKHVVAGMIVGALSELEGTEPIFDNGTLDSTNYPLLGVMLSMGVIENKQLVGRGGPIQNIEQRISDTSGYPVAETSGLENVTPTKAEVETMGPPVPEWMENLKNYPSFIKKMDSGQITKEFEKEPTDWLLEKLAYRINYLAEQLSEPKHEKETKELETIAKWLGSFGMELKGDSPLAKVRYGITMLRGGLVALQDLYQEMRPEERALTNYLKKIKANNKLFTVYKKYLSSLDSNAANLFEGISPDATGYIRKVQNRIDSRLGSSEIEKAQSAWFSQYYPAFSPEREDIEMSSIEAQMYDKIAVLDPMSAKAFAEYIRQAKSGGLDSMEERKAVVSTVAKLNRIHPLLVQRYFYASANLADICEGNRDAFLQAMTALAARIDQAAQPFVSRMSPSSQLLPLNARKTIIHLDNALQEVSKIEKAALSQYERMELMDDKVLVRQTPPHSIEQRPPGYAPKLLEPLDRGKYEISPYPFPPRIWFPQTQIPFTQGGAYSNPKSYGGGLRLPQFRQLQVPSGASAVGASLENYIDPQHPLISIDESLPHLNISSLSPTRLIAEINRAFIPSEMPEYSGELIGGGGFAGIAGRKPADDWEMFGGGMGTLLTPTGGASWGGQMKGETVFGGGTAVAVPIGVPVVSAPPGETEEKVVGIDSALAGYEQSLAGQNKEMIVDAVSTVWDPNNPKQTLFVANMLEDKEGEQVMTTRYYYIEKDGTIFELKGGINDFVDALNFAAGSGNKAFDSPTTYAWNLEPTIRRGGSVLAFDIEKTAWLAHAQAIPFFRKKGEPQPFLLQWTPAEATTVHKKGPLGKKVRATDVHTISFPGQLLTMKEEGEGRTFEDKYLLQDVEYTMRRVKEKDAWQVNAGGGLGHAETGETEESAPEKQWFGRGGIFFRSQSRETRHERGGGGVFYEAGATNMEALALMQEAEEAREYIESLHRVGATIYGSARATDGIVLGGLIHAVEQISKHREEGEKGDYRHDQTFWRVIGMIKGLESESGARLDTSRISWLERMSVEYDELQRQVGNNPMGADDLTEQFYSKYGENVRQVFDYYSFAAQINDDFSMELLMINKEEEGDWLKQKMERVQGKMLVDWESGFWRAFASVPVWGVHGTRASGDVGLVGTGVGQELFNGFWFQKAAVDGGLLLVRAIAENTSGVEEWQWKKGHFIQGAMRVYSSILEDANDFRRLRTEYEEYERAIRRGKYSSIDPEVRDAICNGLDPNIVDQDIIDEIRAGEKLAGLGPGRRRALDNMLLDSLWDNWFSDRKMEIQKKFDGHVRMYFAGSGYFYSDKTYWDIGVFVENIKGFKLYAIGAKRATPGLYAGAEVEIKDFELGAIGNISETGAGTALSAEWKFGPEEYGYFRLGTYGYTRSQSVPQYYAPMYVPMSREGVPEFGLGLYFQIGEGPYMPYPINATTPTGRQPLGTP